MLGHFVYLPLCQTQNCSCRYRQHKRSDYGLWQRNRIIFAGSLACCRYLHFSHGGTADGVDFGDGEEELEQLLSIKIKMAKASLIISYPVLKNTLVL